MKWLRRLIFCSWDIHLSPVYNSGLHNDVGRAGRCTDCNERWGSLKWDCPTTYQGARVKTIDWNQMSELGLIEKINTEILHPLGLAISRNPETGVSAAILISDEGEWEYGPDMESTILPNDVLKRRIEKLNDCPPP